MAAAHDKKPEKEAAAGPAAEADGTAAAAPVSAIKRSLPYLVGGALSMGLGITAGIVTKPKEPESHVIEGAKVPVPTPLDQLLPAQDIVLAQLLVNLADDNRAAMAQLNVVLKIRAKDLPAQAAIVAGCAKGGTLVAPIRDTLISLLGGKQSTELKTPRGKEDLKLEIFDKLQPILFPDPSLGTITNVYFDEFQVS